MDQKSWDAFLKTKKKYQNIVADISNSLPNLKKIQQNFADNRNEGSYKVDTPVVYNTSLDEITKESEIKLILVADNPGKKEQSKENNKYLVGASGKIANNFFKNNIVLDIDFYKNVIILNKTPIHSARTVELKKLILNYNDLTEVLKSSQVSMANILYDFQNSLKVPVWIIGYSEMKPKGIFESYTNTLKQICLKNKDFCDNLYIFRHFSMNQFNIDLKKKTLKGEPLKNSLTRIGEFYKNKVLEYENR